MTVYDTVYGTIWSTLYFWLAACRSIRLPDRVKPAFVKLQIMA